MAEVVVEPSLFIFGGGFAITSLYKSAFSLRANIPYSFSRKRPNLFETSALMLRANIQIEITMNNVKPTISE